MDTPKRQPIGQVPATCPIDSALREDASARVQHIAENMTADLTKLDPLRYCRCADPENCREPIPGYQCRGARAGEVLALRRELDALNAAAIALLDAYGPPHDYDDDHRRLWLALQYAIRVSE